VDRHTVAVTGAFGYSGTYIARRLLGVGHEVITLTNKSGRNHPLGKRISARPLCFGEPDQLQRHLEGADVLINTYWVRFNHRAFTFAQAMDNSATLFRAARKAGVGRVVHLSVTNPSSTSPLEYYRAKARVEQSLKSIGISHAILRPSLLFGGDDILLNNIAWGLRRMPVFIVFGDGSYRLQPVHVDDLAQLAVDEVESQEDKTLDVVGPQTFTYRELVITIGRAIGCRRPVLSVPPGIGYAAIRMLGLIKRDVILTRQEISGLMDNLLYVPGPSLGKIRLTDWLVEHGDEIGRHYSSEMARRQYHTDKSMNQQ
jgi:uncharacterized protein YbjT (DUF2867 family)